MSLLEEIFAHKHREVDRAREALPPARLEALAAAAPTPPDFSAALRDPSRPAPRLIAEIKRRSPSKGVLRPDFDPLSLARAYAASGAAAISVLTDERYFGGSLSHLSAVAGLGTSLPLLRKDFIFGRYQLLEARAAGASAVLLIAALLGAPELAALLGAANELELTPLVEVHTPAELERALAAGAQAIGINNRDLRTFAVELETTARLRPLIPPGIVVVAESGVRSRDDIDRLAAAGVDAVLVGEALVAARDVAARVRDFARGAAFQAAERPADGN